jgi:dihydrolipoamide dehydrogenase
MAQTINVTLPDIGDFEQVDVIEVLVSPGRRVTAEESVIILESDKASMEIPSPEVGVVKEVAVKVGDKVSEGDLILVLETGDKIEAVPESIIDSEAAPEVESVKGVADLHAEVVVLGGGPGGYTAAFRAADLGKKVVLIERYPRLGGVCLNVGCIPSKALLHAAAVINEAAEAEATGISFGKPEVDLDKLRASKDKVVAKLTKGLSGLARQRKVEVVQGEGRFLSPNRIGVETPDGSLSIEFEHAIIACGSRPLVLPGLPHDDPRLMDSTGALALEAVPQRMLVIGGGIIGLEMATIYSALGSKIDIVEMQDSLIPGCDKDLVRPLQKRIGKRYERIMLSTRVTAIEGSKEGLRASFEGARAPDEPQCYDKVLVAVGRVPNGSLIGTEAAGVRVDERGFIPVDSRMRTNVPHIHAIGDVVGQPMLAHKATHEAKVAAEVIAGKPVEFDPIAIPSVAYTDPEVAWAGLTETDAKAEGIEYEKAVFPWAASGRALGIGRDEGMTRLLFDPESKKILGGGITGTHAGELIGEVVLALEMGADTEDIGLTVHPHPTLNETIGMAAEVAEGSITDIMPPRRRK